MSKLGRPLKYGEKTVVSTVKVPKSKKEEIQKVLPELVEQYINGIVSVSIDTDILKKMIPEFVRAGINLKTTTEIEEKRIMELIEECL